MSTDRNPGCCNVTHTPRGCRVLQGNAHPGCCKVTHTLLSLVRGRGRHSRTHPHRTSTCAEKRSHKKRRRPLRTHTTHNVHCVCTRIYVSDQVEGGMRSHALYARCATLGRHGVSRSPVWLKLFSLCHCSIRACVRYLQRCRSSRLSRIMASTRRHWQRSTSWDWKAQQIWHLPSPASSKLRPSGLVRRGWLSAVTQRHLHTLPVFSGRDVNLPLGTSSSPAT